MPIIGKFFPSQKSEEKVFLLLRRHWFTYVGFVVVALVMSIPLFVVAILAISNPDWFTGIFGNLIILALSVYALAVCAVMLYGFIDYYLDVYILTNERIVNIEQNGFFKREISELHLHQIQDVSARVNGIFATMFHYGDVYIQTAGEHENFIFKSVPNPYRVSKLIVDLHEAQLEEGEKERIAEGEAMGEYSQETEGKMRDNLDLESANPAALALARRRTKDFLRGGKIEETDLKQQIEEELTQQHYDKLLDNIKNSKKYDHKPESTTPAQRKESPEKESAEQESTSISNNHEEGEMQEDQEVDL